MSNRVTFVVAAALCGFLTLGTAVAQDAPAEAQPTTQPAAAPVVPEGAEVVMARVIEVVGDVKHAPLESRDYQVCEVGDEYPPQTKLITGVRSSIKLQFGAGEPFTVMMIDSVGKTVLAEAFRTEDAQNIRVGVGYGRIRAGVAEGGIRSDFTVDCPVATLSKRGTWGFTLVYERGTDVFGIGLADSGQVDALNRITAQRRTVLPGEYVTNAMRMWIEQLRFERNVPIPDILGRGDIEVVFNDLKNSGLGVLEPGRGYANIISLENSIARNDFRRLLREQGLPIVLPGFSPRNELRAEGFFGTGRGDQLIEVVISQTDKLVERGFARPGRYLFRRSAVENWMRNNR